MSPQQKALIVPEKQGKLEVGSRSIPNPGSGELLVKVQSAALNPIDYHMVFLKHYPAVPGVDIAGIVEELGEGVNNFRKGDKVLDNLPYLLGICSTLVYRLAHGAFNNDKAAFQQYTLTVANFTAKVSCGVGPRATLWAISRLDPFKLIFRRCSHRSCGVRYCSDEHVRRISPRSRLNPSLGEKWQQ
jgi:hypothetical protein